MPQRRIRRTKGAASTVASDVSLLLELWRIRAQPNNARSAYQQLAERPSKKGGATTAKELKLRVADLREQLRARSPELADRFVGKVALAAPVPEAVPAKPPVTREHRSSSAFNVFAAECRARSDAQSMCTSTLATQIITEWANLDVTTRCRSRAASTSSCWIADIRHRLCTLRAAERPHDTGGV